MNIVVEMALGPKEGPARLAGKAVVGVELAGGAGRVANLDDSQADPVLVRDQVVAGQAGSAIAQAWKFLVPNKALSVITGPRPILVTLFAVGSTGPTDSSGDRGSIRVKIVGSSKADDAAC